MNARIDHQVWWSDERFLPRGDPERNETQAREALLDHIDVPLENVHAMASSDGLHELEGAATAYADDLATFAADGGAAQ